MGLLLYDNPVSSNALKVRFMLAELGLGYERRTVPFDLPRPDWYLAVNPVGGIPALDDGRPRRFGVECDPPVPRAPRGARRPLSRQPPGARCPRRVPRPLGLHVPTGLLPA